MAQILIAINDLNVKGAEVRIVTSLRPAAVGCSVTPAESLAMDLLRLARNRGATIEARLGQPDVMATTQEQPA